MRELYDCRRTNMDKFDTVNYKSINDILFISQLDDKYIS